MLWKTHLSISLAVALIVFPSITHKILFIPIVLLANFIPDIDSKESIFGKRIYFRPLQWIFSHRGIIHSYTFCTLISLVLALAYPPVALPFFLGYASHLIADSFTLDGIQPFWPIKSKVQGVVRTGSILEKQIFVISVITNVALLIRLVV